MFYVREYDSKPLVRAFTRRLGVDVATRVIELYNAIMGESKRPSFDVAKTAMVYARYCGERPYRNCANCVLNKNCPIPKRLRNLASEV